MLRPEGWEHLRAAIGESRAALAGRTLWMVNSTAAGGGVAELLRTLMPYWLDAGFDVRWVVVRARPAFFRVTKRLHNMLHGHPGDGGGLGAAERRVYEDGLAPSRAALERRVCAGDVVVLHDPQTAGLAPALAAAGAHVVWRSHVGVDRPDPLVRAVEDFLRPYVRHTEAAVFTRPHDPLPQRGPARTAVIHPCIDPCSPKNRDMDEDEARALLAEAGLVVGGGARGAAARLTSVRRTGGALRAGGGRLVVHLARWDRLKDPVGVIDAFVAGVLDRCDARLVLAGPTVRAVADDPEAVATYREVEARWAGLPRAERDRIHLFRLSMRDLELNGRIVNALQREASVVVKKSVAEGFGLGVTEAMWKRRPVVASAVGGHRDQIEHEVSGLLVEDAHDPVRFGAAVADVLLDPALARRLGDGGRERVRTLFLPDRHMAAWTRLLASLVTGADAGVASAAAGSVAPR